MMVLLGPITQAPVMQGLHALVEAKGIGLCTVFSFLSLDRLSEMFDLPIKTVHSIVSKMIIKEDLLVS